MSQGRHREGQAPDELIDDHQPDMWEPRSQAVTFPRCLVGLCFAPRQDDHECLGQDAEVRAQRELVDVLNVLMDVVE